MDLQERVSLIIGGANGIGGAGTVALAERGSKVAIADLDEKTGRQLVNTLSSAGCDAIFIHTDVLDDGSVENAITEAEKEFGKLDVIVNSAGAVARDGDAIFERNVDMMLTGVWRGAKFGLPALRRAGGGSIINVSSICGITGSNVAPMGYVPGKHGVVGLTKDLALRCASENIRVNAVCPGQIETQMNAANRPTEQASHDYITQTMRVPMGRWGRPEEIGSVIAFLASEDSSFITGQAIVVDGGQTAR